MVTPIHPAVERRARWLLRLLILWGVAVVVKLFYLQIIKHDEFAELAESQQTRLVEIPAHRGTIYDRNGHVLAISIPVETVVVNPMQLPNIEVAAALLADILKLDQREMLANLQAKAAEKRGYYKVATNISQDQLKSLKSLKLGWIQFESSSVRVYPHDNLAAHILGGVDFEQHGNAGIEQGLEDELAGRPGYASMITDVQHRGFQSSVEVEPIPGNDVRLTIDYRIQYELEKQLGDAIEKCKCWSGRGLVMDPNTGEILAMASYPTYNPNDRAAEISARQNLAVQSAIEPGSVFKVFTIASAIEEHTVKPTTGFHCGNGRLNLFGRVIHDSNHHGYGYLSVEDILAKSSNIGAIHVGLTLGDKRLHDYIKRFGFGSRTGLPLPGESTGRVIRLNKWTKSSIGSVAMGHEVMTTTTQLGRAASVIANGGTLLAPKLVSSITTPGTNGVHLRRATYEDQPEEQPKTIISPETVVTMRKMMEHVVLEGTGKPAKIPGYSAGGKTGSAQIYDPKTKQYLHKYHASFMGFTPVNNPRLVTVITINGSSLYGGVVAAPVFKDVTASALRILNIPKDLPDEPTKFVKTSDVIEADVSDALLTEEKPVENSENSATEVTTNTLVTPNLMGMTLRAVLEETSKKGFRIDPSGSGLVREQLPAPGQPIAYGQKIRLRFAR
jgi:cell division protein FtsI (penicillin-binding protein 3)